MNRIDQLFKEKKNNILNIYCTAGFPHLESTIKVIEALEKNGADIIEIGIPYSDPLADGPVIQKSNMQALQNGMNLNLLFSQLQQIKASITVPIILMGYFNSVLQYGIEKFCAAAEDAGVSGIILPDLPLYEYEKLYKKIFQKHGLHFIFLVTPETSEKRMKEADKLSGGFIYAVSSSSTTGNTIVKNNNEEYFKKLKLLKFSKPVLVGFGISDKESFDKACVYTNGAIIGSAYINAIKKAKNIDLVTKNFIKLIKDGPDL